MIYYCDKTDCPRCHIAKSTRIDVKTRMPVIIHVCTCAGREKQNGCCLRCAGMRD